MSPTCSLRRIVFGAPHVIDLDEYRFVAERAAAAGATHITVSGLPQKSRWEIDDPTDPYFQWSIYNPTMFFFAVPEAMRDFVPKDYAARAMDWLRKQSQIADDVGLRRVFVCREPRYWPEALYERHPDWRGPRCDHPRRSRHPRFALCVDHPEVLAMYEQAAKEITDAAGGLDMFVITSNDAGTGLCWSWKLYNNANGPSACKGRHMGLRVGDLLGSIVAGARDAGGETLALLGAKFTPEEQALVVESLPEGAGVVDMPTFGRNVPRMAEMRVPVLQPAIGIPHAPRILRFLADADSAAHENVLLFSEDPQDVESGLGVIGRFRDCPGRGLVARTRLLQRAAASEFGDDLAEDVVDLWDRIDQAIGLSLLMSYGGTLFRLAVLGQRWLTRPLVAFPSELTPEEKDHYRPFLYQANDEAQAEDLLNTQGLRLISGRNQAVSVRSLLDSVCSICASAARGAKDLAGKASGKAAEALTALSWRLRALNCIVRTCNNTIQFQTILDMATEELGEECPGEKPWFHDGYGDRQKLYDVVRSELDNTQELIRLIELSPVPVLRLADGPAEEDAFTLGAKIVEQLRKKVRITLNHWLDFDRIFVRPNR